jgi:hypothetical protein
MATQSLTRPTWANLHAASAADRPRTAWRDDLIAMTIAAWPVTAMFFDGRNHNNVTGQESFWSTAHIALYSGLTVAAIWVGIVVLKHQLAAGADPLRGAVDLGAIPAGYGLTIVGFVLLGFGGAADFVWHAAYGFEVNLEAIYSPPHLVLTTGGFLVAATGIRAMWAKRDTAPGFVRFLPAAFSTVLLISVLSFVTMYLSAFMTSVSPTSAFMADIERLDDVRFDESLSLNAGLTSYGDESWPYYFYSGSHGIAAMLVTTAVLLGPVLMLLRRWRPPLGAVTLIYGLFGLLVNVMTEYRDIVLIVPLLLTGATVDILVRRFRPPGRATTAGIRVIGTAAPAALWISYFVVLELDEGLGWGPSLWVGALMLSVLAGLLLSVLVAPPALEPAPAEEAPAP